MQLSWHQCLRYQTKLLSMIPDTVNFDQVSCVFSSVTPDTNSKIKTKTAKNQQWIFTIKNATNLIEIQRVWYHRQKFCLVSKTLGSRKLPWKGQPLVVRNLEKNPPHFIAPRLLDGFSRYLWWIDTIHRTFQKIERFQLRRLYKRL